VTRISVNTSQENPQAIRNDSRNACHPLDAVRARMRELVRFCQRPEHGCFRGWPPDLIEDYLWFHVEQQTLAYVFDECGDVVGLGTAWQFDSSTIAPQSLVHPPEWQPTNPEGDAVLIDHLIAEAPWVLVRLIFAYTLHFPAWERLKLFAIRRGQPVQYDPWKLIRRLYRQANHYNHYAII